MGRKALVQVSQSYETFGKYILLERLAMGGMAEIYLARSLAAAGVSKFFAIKRILPQFSEQIEFIDMFKDEAKIAVNLSHANIVSIFEFGMERQAFYLAMDYVEGSNLRQILNKMKKSGVTFSIEQVIYIIKEVAAGLDAAHRCIDSQTGKPLNIIHRDMSPQNVMISYEGEVKVVDFGIAKAETQIETTRAGTLKGKFGYMSPEQAEGQTIDLRTDIFALGIVFWELLANDRLFVANNEVNTLRKIRDCQIPSLRKINPNIPQELERIVSKALAKDRNLRYQTCAAFQRDLSKFLNRQYPDFSPHDFSVFIKTLFAGEILDRRKKMIEFAKVDTKLIAPAAPASLPAPNYDRTVVTATNTENTSGDGPAKDLGTPEPRPAAKIARPTADVKATPRPSVMPPPPVAPGRVTPSLGQREHKELAAPSEASNLSFDRTGFRDRTQFSGSFSDPNFNHGGTRNAYTRPTIHVKRSSSASMPIFFILIGLIAGGGAYYYANPERAAFLAQRGIEEVSKVLGRQSQLDNSSTANQGQAASPESVRHVIRVSSNPPGAAISVNGRIHSDVTPTSLRLEEGDDVTILLHVEGFKDYEEHFQVTGPKEIKQTLVPESQAKLFVHVTGAGQIFIDDRPIAPPSRPGEPYKVPSGREFKVSVFDEKTNTGDEIRLTVAEGQTRKITLIPRANYRPSNKPQ